MALTFHGPARRAMAVPLGGIGTGQVALRADGALDQWQLGNTVNHRAWVPDALFGLRVSALGAGRPGEVARRVLRCPPPPAPDPVPPDSDDWSVPPMPELGWPPMASATATVRYPFVRIAYQDTEIPVEAALCAYSPFVPTDTAASSLPLVEYRVELHNTASLPLFGFVVCNAQNIVGWDGVSPIDGVTNLGYGGNVNRLVGGGATTAILMDNPSLPDDDPFAGELAVWTDAPCLPLPRTDGPQVALRAAEAIALIDAAGLRDFSDARLRANLHRITPPVRCPHGPSATGRTWDGALCAAWALEPGERGTVRFLQAWRFPNRYVDFLQQHVEYGPGGRRLWVGNDYARRFTGALEVVRHFLDNETDLATGSREWADAVAGADLPEQVRELVAVQCAAVRTPVTFRTEDGRFHGHEGGNGTSNANWSGDVGGSCPVDCTHVWNYAQAVSRLFPDLERTMRQSEWDTQHPDGALPHRAVLPSWLPQYQNRIGGPLEPALDGMLGAVLKTYREARNGGGTALLAQYWPALTAVLDHVHNHWETDGILCGPQPSTYDQPLSGPNMIIGSLWLAALATMSAVAEHLGEPEPARRYARLREQAAERYDTLLWNGEYYAQTDPADRFDIGTGCHSDQLVGQWWAHQLDLGHLLPPEHVRGALDAILHHNDRTRLSHVDLGRRTYADPGDGGLVNCSWPRGGRPDRPVLYADESWTGTEYQVAAHCLMEGLADGGLAVLTAVHRRHDGTRRNPFNHVETGDHYVRAMSGWTALEAVTGLRYDSLTRRLRVRAGCGRVPFVAGTGWGETETDPSGGIRLWLRRGELAVDELCVGGRVHRLPGTVLRPGDPLVRP